MKHICQIIFVVSAALFAQSALAASRCSSLTVKQADKAVELAQIALQNGSNVMIYSSKEAGLIKPLGVWRETKWKNGRSQSIVRLDDRIVDISLLYIAQNSSSRVAYNLGWLAGCRPSWKQPVTIPNY